MAQKRVQTQPCALTHRLNHRFVHLLLTSWLTSTVGRSIDLLSYILQICHTKKWCWVWRSQQLALLHHLALGSQVLLSGKGTRAVEVHLRTEASLRSQQLLRVIPCWCIWYHDGCFGLARQCRGPSGVCHWEKTNIVTETE